MPDKIENCRVCGALTNYLWDGKLLDLKYVRYFECPHCSYVQTEYPYWLDRAYFEAINQCDTGIMVRNLANTNIVLATLLSIGNLDCRVIDCAGGYGILVRLLRDLGIDAFWSDLYCENLVTRGFEYTIGGGGLVTAFESFEHFVNPSDEFSRLLDIAPNVLISTCIIPQPTPKQQDWWYFGKEHGQHIGFFRLKTLKYFASKHGKYLVSDGRALHFFSAMPVNRVTWWVLLKLRKLLPYILRYKLQSKTTQDHLSIAKNNL